MASRNSKKTNRVDRNKKDYLLPIDKKESYRWLGNYNKANEYAKRLPNTKIVSIANCEGDIYKEAHNSFDETKSQAHYLIRAKTDRKVCTEGGKATEKRVKSALKATTPLGYLSLEISGTKKKKSRVADLTIYSKKIHIGLPEASGSNATSQQIVFFLYQGNKLFIDRAGKL